MIRICFNSSIFCHNLSVSRAVLCIVNHFEIGSYVQIHVPERNVFYSLKLYVYYLHLSVLKVTSKSRQACSLSKNSDYVILNQNFPFYFSKRTLYLTFSKKPGNRYKRYLKRRKSDFMFPKHRRRNRGCPPPQSVSICFRRHCKVFLHLLI